MSLFETRSDQLFPILNSAQIALARRFATEPEHRFGPGERLFAIGERDAPVFLVLSGEIAISRRDGAGRPGVVTTHGAGHFTGDLQQLDGRAALVDAHAGPAGCTAVTFDGPHLRALIIGSAELGEIVMRALILRRMSLIAEGHAGAVLVGDPGEPALRRLQGFLGRNSQPYSVLHATADLEAQGLLERLGLRREDLPIVVCPDGTVLKRPSEAELAPRLGITRPLDPNKLYDVAIVGAGPAGLAAAVYAASEGLSALVLDCRVIGGQAGASNRIENYLGFPTGISGRALAGRAFAQALKFGADIVVPAEVEAIECPAHDRPRAEPFALRLVGGQRVQARTVVIASGVRYRRPELANLALFEGAGVSYWASPIEAQLCQGQEVALVGGGNSAGQAAVFLAPQVRRLHLIVRGRALETTMSRYLIDRLAALPNVVTHLSSMVTSLEGDAAGGLRALEVRSLATAETFRIDTQYLFLFIGGDANTGWLRGCPIALDDKGFVQTGAAVATLDGSVGQELQTSVPGVFAIGDARSGSTKRVAAAVGEGARVVAAIHAILAKQ